MKRESKSDSKFHNLLILNNLAPVAQWIEQRTSKARLRILKHAETSGKIEVSAFCSFLEKTLFIVVNGGAQVS